MGQAPISPSSPFSGQALGFLTVPEPCLLLIPTLWELWSVFQSRLKGRVLHHVLLLVSSAGHLAFLAPCGREDAFPYPLPSGSTQLESQHSVTESVLVLFYK